MVTSIEGALRLGHMALRVLVVCTANVCRSPMAAGLLAAHLAAIGADASVTSAGTASYELPVDPVAVAAARALGVEIWAHRPRMLDRALLAHDGQHLIITMTREHLRHVVTTDRTAWRRTFTLRELVRRASSGGRVDESVTGEERFAGVIGELAAPRRANDLIDNDPDDDIADPYGQGIAAVRRAAAELDLLTGSLAKLLPW